MSVPMAALIGGPMDSHFQLLLAWDAPGCPEELLVVLGEQDVTGLYYDTPRPGPQVHRPAPTPEARQHRYVARGARTGPVVPYDYAGEVPIAPPAEPCVCAELGPLAPCSTCSAVTP